MKKGGRKGPHSLRSTTEHRRKETLNQQSTCTRWIDRERERERERERYERRPQCCYGTESFLLDTSWYILGFEREE